MNEQAASVAQVFNFINSFHEQCRNMIRDAVRLLRDNQQIYLTHHKSWDYAAKPNDRFLEQEYSSVRRCWSTFLPSGDLSRAALFFLEFFHPHRLVTPALMYGAVDPGDAGFEATDRWAVYNVIVDAEKGAGTVSVSHNGPITLVKGQMPKTFDEAALVRVSLETSRDQPALERIVVSPLAALLNGSHAEAIARLDGVATEVWPSAHVDTTDEEDDESEQA